MGISEFTRRLKVVYHCNNKKVFECVKVAYEMAKDAHEGCDISENDLRRIGYAHFIDLLRNGEYDLETMQFI